MEPQGGFVAIFRFGKQGRGKQRVVATHKGGQSKGAPANQKPAGQGKPSQKGKLRRKGKTGHKGKAASRVGSGKLTR